MDSPPGAKRKKFFTKGEILEKLKETDGQVQQLSEFICEELCPFDATKDEEIMIEDRLERMKAVTESLASKVYKLQKAFKDRKFRHKPEVLDEKIISCSQHSILQSQPQGDSLSLTDSQGQSSDISLENSQGQNMASGDVNSQLLTYKKKPLNQNITAFTRSRRVAEKRESLNEWAEEEGVTSTELLGYLLYLENYHAGTTIMPYNTIQQLIALPDLLAAAENKNNDLLHNLSFLPLFWPDLILILRWNSRVLPQKNEYFNVFLKNTSKTGKLSQPPLGLFEIISPPKKPF